MTKVAISESLREELESFLKKNRKADLVTSYLFFVERRFNVKPVIYAKERKIYLGKEQLIASLEKQGKLWRETEIKIQMGQLTVNEETKRIYICPFTGKVFGDNTHPNPQDAIYEWVSNCPENTERLDGIRVKRFYVSEDPEVIKNYITRRKAPVAKVVYSSAVTGKLFNSKKSVIDDFVQHQLREIPLDQVPSQNRFQIDEELLQFIQKQMEESKLAAFVEAMSSIESLAPFAEGWMEEEREES